VKDVGGGHMNNVAFGGVLAVDHGEMPIGFGVENVNDLA
jgi:hypothetical protein